MSGRAAGDDPRRAGSVSDSGSRYAVEVLVDGRALPLKTFVHDMVGGAAMGLVSGLKGVEDPARLEIRVRRVRQ